MSFFCNKVSKYIIQLLAKAPFFNRYFHKRNFPEIKATDIFNEKLINILFPFTKQNIIEM